jgi:hypothetical protein
MASRKIFSNRNIDDLSDSDNEIELNLGDPQGSPLTYTESLMKSLSSGDQRERELGAISIINLSKKLPDSVVKSVLSSDILKLLSERLMDVQISVSFLAIDGFLRLAKLSQNIGSVNIFEAAFEKNQVFNV